MRTAGYTDRIGTREKIRRRGSELVVGLTALVAVGCGVDGESKNAPQNNSAAIETPGVSSEVPSSSKTESDIPTDSLKQDIYHIAHMFDGGCEIGSVEDSQGPSAMLGIAMQDRNNVMVTLNFTMSQGALSALEGRTDTEIVGARVFNVSTESHGRQIPSGPKQEAEFDIEMQSLTQGADGSLALRQSLYLPGPNSSDAHDPISIKLKTQAWKNGDLTEIETSEPVCDGQLVYEDGVWQLAK